jgi:hypothetical protein
MKIAPFMECAFKKSGQVYYGGGFAVNLHGYQRFTGDADLWLEDTLDNRKKLRKAFFEMELGIGESVFSGML